ncbi:MAG: VOC family protein [Propionibacteriaceae bacterium]
MTVRKEAWPDGRPAWIDLSITDIDRSRDFYRAVFGWEYTDSEPEFGGYFYAQVNGEPVAGMAPPMEGMEESPHVWTTYLAVTDSAATGAKIEAAGAQSVFPPMEVGPFGTMGLYVDPTGATFGTWQPGSHTGFNVVDEHGAPGWHEVMVDDFEKGKAFYAEVFGYEYEDISNEGMSYAMFTAPGDQMSGGLANFDDNPPGWGIVFQVDDTDAAAAVIAANGGKVTTEPFDFQYGRLAVATGPDGEEFSLIQPPAQPAS